MTLASQFGDLARTTREATVLFIDKRCDFLDVVDRDWREAFRQEGESDNLVLYVRRHADS